MSRALAAALLAVLVVPGMGCAAGRPPATPGATSPRSPAASAAASDIDPATRSGRAAILEAMNGVIEDNYVTPDGDPLSQRLLEQRPRLLDITDPAAFYAAVNSLLRRSGNDHLYLYLPGRDLFDREADEDSVLGLSATEVDGYTFVDDVWEGGPAALAGILFGDELLPLADQKPTVDPLPAGVQRVTLWLRRNRETDPELLSVEAAVGDTLWYMSEATRSSIRRLRRGECTFGTLHLRTFADADLIQELITGAHFDGADGIILDLRGNRGGEIRLASELFDLLTREPSVLIEHRERQYTFPPTSWNKPLAVLVDGATRSAAELFAAAVQVRGLGTVIGTGTAGQVRASRLFDLPDGSRLLVPVSTILLPDGTDLEGRGVQPDIEVERPVIYAEGADPPFQRALQLLEEETICAEDLPEETFPQHDLGHPAGDGPAGGAVP